MNEQEIKILKTSRDQRELKKLANKLAASDRKEEIGLLLQFMNNQEFLSRLDTPEDYQNIYSKLRLASIINVLMKNPGEPAYHAIIHLIKAGDFVRNILRIQLLIHALSATRPLVPQAVDYLNKVSIAESPLVYDVIKTLCINQSKPAMQMLEEKIIQLQLPDNDQKITWLRDLFLPRRNDEALLDCCEKILHHSNNAHFKTELVDVLFDYKPDAWYVGCRRPKPPPREDASGEARKILTRIGEFAFTDLNLTPEQRKQVKDVLGSINS